MNKTRTRLLEVSIWIGETHAWEWEVCSNGIMLANGYNEERVAAKFDANNALFFLLASGSSCP